MNKVFTLADALYSLYPGVEWTIYGNDYNQLIFHNGETKPSLEELNTEVARLQADYDSKLYQRQRQPEYPPLQDLADALYWQSKGDNSKLQAYLASCEAVKQKYPKEA
jgi:hypothetical protein